MTNKRRHPERSEGPGIDRTSRRSIGARSFAALRMTAVVAPLLMIGCFPKPNKANIELRKQVQSLEVKIAGLESGRAADKAAIDSLSSDRTIQTLPSDKLGRLFVTSSLKFKNIVVGEDLDANTPGDEGFKIGIVPVDEFGDEFKAAGSLAVELFDLAVPDTRLGQWTVDTAEARKKWLSSFVFDGYVLPFKWQTPPTNEKLLVKVTFVEELTGRKFEATSELNVKPPER